MPNAAVSGRDARHPTGRKPGVAQGITVVAAGFLPILAIVSLFPTVPAIITHFAPRDPSAIIKVPSAVAAPGLTIALLAIFAGMATDRFGRRTMLLWATAFYALLGSAPFFLDSLDGLYVSRLLLGVTEAAVLTTMNTLIGDYWDEKGRRTWLSLQGMAGPLLASVVIASSGAATAWRWNASFLIYLVAVPIFFATWAFLYEPTPQPHEQPQDAATPVATPFPWRDVAIFAPVTLFAAMLYYVFIINGGSVWQEVGVQNSADIGRLSALPSLFTVVGAGIYWLVGKRSARLQLSLFLTLIGGGLIIMGLIHDWRGMIAGMILQQTGVGMAVPVLIGWVQNYLPFAHRGRGMGIWTACFFFGQFLSPVVVGLVRMGAGTMQGAFVITGAIGLAGALIVNLVLAARRTPSAS